MSRPAAYVELSNRSLRIIPMSAHFRVVGVLGMDLIFSFYCVCLERFGTFLLWLAIAKASAMLCHRPENAFNDGQQIMERQSMNTKQSIPETWKTSHLIVLVGGNPLPNYVAGKTLLQENGVLHLLHPSPPEKSPSASETIWGEGKD